MKPDNPFPDIFDGLLKGKLPEMTFDLNEDIPTKEQREARERDENLKEALRSLKEALGE